MKKNIVFVVLATMLLASCSKTETPTNTPTTNVPQVEQTQTDDNSSTPENSSDEVSIDETLNELDDLVAGLDELDEGGYKIPEDHKNATFELASEYPNPNGDINSVKYIIKMDETGRISDVQVEQIEIQAPSRTPITNFANSVNEQVKGMTLEEAEFVSTISGASLTTASFKKAIKPYIVPSVSVE